MVDRASIVHVRTPTFRRPDALRRCLQSLQQQTWQSWICDVYDDDAQESGRAVCEGMNDPRIRYNPNRPQKFASKNIDSCFTSDNPHGATYFCVVEDDNFIMPSFMEANIELMAREGVEIMLRNQKIELRAGTTEARLSDYGVLDYLYTEGLYSAAEARMALLFGIGVSNGGLFWSRNARSIIEIRVPCTATMQEYMRTFAIVEPIYVAMDSLAVWAENAEHTTRNAELKVGYLRRELDLKNSINAIRRATWRRTPSELRGNALDNRRFAVDRAEREKALAKALILSPLGTRLFAPGNFKQFMRGLAITVLGRTADTLPGFIAGIRG